MAELNLEPTGEPIQDYYTSLEEYDQIDVTHEGAVRSAFLPLLQQCGRQLDWILVTEYAVHLPQNKRIVIDGAFEDADKRPHGYWEAKDMDDDLPVEVQRKFGEGYPSNNILFQNPQRAILWQDGHEVRDADLTDPIQLIEVLVLSLLTAQQKTTNGSGQSPSSVTRCLRWVKTWLNASKRHG